MTRTNTSPTTSAPRRRSPARFDQRRATLALLIASAGFFGYSAVQASQPQPNFGRHAAATATTTGTAASQASTASTSPEGSQP